MQAEAMWNEDKKASAGDRLSYLIPKVDPDWLEWCGTILSSEWRTLPDCPGCYGMESDGQVVYIGQAHHLRKRVSQHINRPGGFPCSHVRWVTCVAAELNKLERDLIAVHAPPYNRKTGVWTDWRTHLLCPVAKLIGSKTSSQPVEHMTR